jgi:hypothetical protein
MIAASPEAEIMALLQAEILALPQAEILALPQAEILALPAAAPDTHARRHHRSPARGLVARMPRPRCSPAPPHQSGPDAR